nr:antibiotic biosynthesis monooxygenase [Corynebacterium lactis]
MVVRLRGKLICDTSSQVDLVRSLIGEHIRLTRLEPGCLRFEVNETSDSRIWSVSEEFANQQAFDAHQRRVKDSEWGRRTSAIRRDYVVDRGAQ